MARIVNRVERVVNRVADFEKVSFEQFEKDGKKHIFNARFIDMKNFMRILLFQLEQQSSQQDMILYSI